MRKVSARFGDMRQEGVGQKDDLFLGFSRVHRVYGEEVRRQFAGFGFACLADGDARIDTAELVVESGRDLDHLPAVRADEPGIGGQQALQQRGSAAHHSDDDDRRGDPLVEDLRVAADPLLGAQPHAQAVDDARPQDVRADGVEVSVWVVGQQHAERACEVARTPIGQ